MGKTVSDSKHTISIHALVKRATYRLTVYTCHFRISIHALVKRATSSKHSGNDFFDISIHALVKRATACSSNLLLLYFISIHALVKRATVRFGCDIFKAVNFNPRPRKEGDIPLWVSSSTQPHFNPRPRKEGDEIAYRYYKKENISIHALVKRATAVYANSSHLLHYFNPRPRKEGDDLANAPTT